MEKHEWNRITRALTDRECEATDGLPPQTREQLEAMHGQVWDSFTLARDYEVEVFVDRCVVAVRRSDGTRGTLMYQNNPRFYWGFK